MTTSERRPTLRTAVPGDAARIAALKRASVREVFPRFYDQEQTAAAAVHLTRPDHLLLADGTYLVHEVDGEVVACGGWSRRALLHPGAGDGDRLLDPRHEAARVRAMFVRGDWTRRGLGREILEAGARAAAAAGFRTLVLMATLPGVPLYASCGFTEARRVGVPLGHGPTLGCALMHRAAAPAR